MFDFGPLCVHLSNETIYSILVPNYQKHIASFSRQIYKNLIFFSFILFFPNYLFSYSNTKWDEASAKFFIGCWYLKKIRVKLELNLFLFIYKQQQLENLKSEWNAIRRTLKVFSYFWLLRSNDLRSRESAFVRLFLFLSF